MAYTIQTVLGSDAFNTQLKADILAAGWVLSWSLASTEVDPVTGQTLTVDMYTFKSPTGVVASFKYTPGNSNDLAHINFVGAIDVNTGAGWYNQHPSSSATHTIPLDAILSTKYWLSITDNRINITYKISASYFVVSVGRFLPYASPTEYPHPLFVGSITRGITDWRSTTARTFIDPFFADHSQFMDVSGLWHNFTKPDSSGRVNGYTLNYRGTQTYINNDLLTASESMTRSTLHAGTHPCLGGGHHISRVPIQHRAAAGDYTAGTTFGVLDGFRRVVGNGQVPENILTLSTLGLITAQNITYNTPNDYFAMETL